MIPRRGLITGLATFLAAPAIVRASSLDVLRGVPMEQYEWTTYGLGYTVTYKGYDELQNILRVCPGMIERAA
mgnify:CR=1 FL=1